MVGEERQYGFENGGCGLLGTERVQAMVGAAPGLYLYGHFMH